MRSRTTAAFRKALESVPPQVRSQSQRTYELFRSNPNHPSLRFKSVHLGEKEHEAAMNRFPGPLPTGVVPDDDAFL